MVTSERDPKVDRAFPSAVLDGYALRSPEDSIYNCIAWAASVTNIAWWPTPHPVPGAFWPDGLPREHSLSAFMQAYATLGYQDSGMDGSLEPDFERIAIYATTDGKPQHAARQLRDGVWTSKLGKYRDIHHNTPAAIENESNYGRVVRYMKRQRKQDHICLRTPNNADMPLLP